MVVGESTNRHTQFPELPALMPANALLVVNDTRVTPARLRAKKTSGGNVELLVLRPDGPRWQCLVKTHKRLRPGTALQLVGRGAGGSPTIVVGERHADGSYSMDLGGDVQGLLAAWGDIPLPPYIRRATTELDTERYQTLFSRVAGAVAAPTAGLHFSPAVLAALEARGVELCRVTLHVGPGTFAPIRNDGGEHDLDKHVMHVEDYDVPVSTAQRFSNAKRQGRPIVAVGTTVIRTLESAFRNGELHAGSGATQLFIRPPYTFRTADFLVTNFHLPQSTLLMLVSAFAGHERIRAAYRDAVSERYRFFSYGDAMFLSRLSGTS